MADMEMDDRLDAVMDGFSGAGASNSLLDDAAAIIRLARMDTLAYGRVRKAEAKALGCSVAALDTEVRAHQRSVRVQSVTGVAKPWLSKCQITQQGELRSNLFNAALALETDPRARDLEGVMHLSSRLPLA